MINSSYVWRALVSKPFIQLHEYAEKHVHIRFWSNTNFQDYLNLASYCIFLCNDLYSLRSESESFGGQLDKIDNTVVVISKLNNMSIDQALAETCCLCIHYEDLLQRKRQCLLQQFGPWSFPLWPGLPIESSTWSEEISRLQLDCYKIDTKPDPRLKWKLIT